MIIKWLSAVLVMACVNAPCVAEEAPAAAETFRILSWNISDEAFSTEPAAFDALLRWANPDIVLLDEVSPTADFQALSKSLAELRPGEDAPWNITVGASGGRQRDVIASRAPLETVPEFSSIVPYPTEDRRRILERLTPDHRSSWERSMDSGIPVNGAVILINKRRLLVVITDLSCCGDGPESAQELGRRVEAREIRRLIQEVLTRTRVDGVIFAGDFNMVGSTFPMALLTGPYPPPHSGLIPAEIYHPDGVTTWTWDGRGTPFHSNTLDYQFYGPAGLRMKSGFIVDTERLPPEVLEQHQLNIDMSKQASNHRALVVEYGWIKREGS